MGEAILVGRGGSGGGNKYEFKTEIITENCIWTVPRSKDQEFFIRIFGGGSADEKTWYYKDGKSYDNYGYKGGGGGSMNYGQIYLKEGNQVSITIGAGGKPGGSTTYSNSRGGTSSFGTYISAVGGSHFKDSTNNSIGAGGGATAVRNTYGYASFQDAMSSLQFGGGGCVAEYDEDNLYNYGYQANGGIYGGGGGLGVNTASSYLMSISLGGYGNGGTMQKRATNGQNTISSHPYELAGKGLNGGYCGGGGGLGGNGGNGAYNSTTNRGAGGGGGGYGARGGNGALSNFGCAGGGGGGYGILGRGGDGFANNNYFCGGGGGGYGPGADKNNNAGYAGGGAAGKDGGSGICIIQYYV